jgi:hypothetical protein
MQVPSVPPPVVATALPQEIAAKAVPHMQAAAPLLQTAVTPTPKDEKLNSVRRDKNSRHDNHKEKQNMPDDDGEKSEHSVNIRI